MSPSARQTGRVLVRSGHTSPPTGRRRTEQLIAGAKPACVVTVPVPGARAAHRQLARPLVGEGIARHRAAADRSRSPRHRPGPHSARPVWPLKLMPVPPVRMTGTPPMRTVGSTSPSGTKLPPLMVMNTPPDVRPAVGRIELIVGARNRMCSVQHRRTPVSRVAKSVARRRHRPVALRPAKMPSGACGLNVPRNGALPVVMEVAAASSKVVRSPSRHPTP